MIINPLEKQGLELVMKRKIEGDSTKIQNQRNIAMCLKVCYNHQRYM